MVAVFYVRLYFNDLVLIKSLIKFISTTPKLKSNSPLKITITAEQTISVNKTPNTDNSNFSNNIPKNAVGIIDKEVKREVFKYFGLYIKRLSRSFRFSTEVKP